MTMKIMRFSQRGLVGHWRFNEGTGSTAYDSSPFGNNGTIHGASWVRGKFGYALKFDGSDDYIIIADFNNNIGDKITIEAWVKRETSSDRYAIWDDWKYLTNKRAVFFRINTDGTLKFFVSSNGTSEDSSQTTDTIDTNWHHVAVTFNAGNVKFYIDGSESLSDTLSQTSIFNSNQAKHIGLYYEASEYFKGTIDEVRIYNRPLSAEEIKIHYAFTKYIKPHFIIMRRKL